MALENKIKASFGIFAKQIGWKNETNLSLFFEVSATLVMFTIDGKKG
jgi:hypothetical protein